MARNRPIATVLQEYSERRKGKVVSSRDELHRRFAGLDWRIQKKVIQLHLERSKTERQWAYLMLLDYWDVGFATTIEKLWNEFHEQRCSWLVIRYLSQDFIRSNIDSLCDVDYKNYFFIANQLGRDKDFNIDRTKLSASEYLSVLRITGRYCTNKEALSLLKEITIEVCKNDDTPVNVASKMTSRMNGVCARQVPQLSKAFYDICEMHLEPAIECFMAWSDKTSEDVAKSEEWKELNRGSVADFDYNIKACRILLKYLLINLNILDGTEEGLVKTYSGKRKRIKKEEETLKKMWLYNPEVYELIEKLDLKIDELPF